MSSGLCSDGHRLRLVLETDGLCLTGKFVCDFASACFVPRAIGDDRLELKYAPVPDAPKRDCAEVKQLEQERKADVEQVCRLSGRELKLWKGAPGHSSIVAEVRGIAIAYFVGAFASWSSRRRWQCRYSTKWRPLQWMPRLSAVAES